VVRLAPDDQAALADIESALITELAEAVKEYCADENYHLRGPVVVTIEIDQSVSTGRIEVDSSVRKAGASEIVAKVTLPDDRKITLGKDTLIIGRLAECDIAFDDSMAPRSTASPSPSNGRFATATSFRSEVIPFVTRLSKPQRGYFT
jgi:hypothetical protein